MNNYIIYDDIGKGRNSVVQKVDLDLSGEKEAFFGVRHFEKFF